MSALFDFLIVQSTLGPAEFEPKFLAFPVLTLFTLLLDEYPTRIGSFSGAERTKSFIEKCRDQALGCL